MLIRDIQAIGIFIKKNRGQCGKWEGKTLIIFSIKYNYIFRYLPEKYPGNLSLLQMLFQNHFFPHFAEFPD